MQIVWMLFCQEGYQSSIPNPFALYVCVALFTRHVPEKKINPIYKHVQNPTQVQRDFRVLGSFNFKLGPRGVSGTDSDQREIRGGRC